jgi:hypothetical protein
MLFLLAGYEVELKELTGRGGRRAVVTRLSYWRAQVATTGETLHSRCEGIWAKHHEVRRPPSTTTTTDANSLRQRRHSGGRIIGYPRPQVVRDSAGPAADELPRILVAWVARTMGPGSRIQVVRRLPMGQLASEPRADCGRRDGRVHRLVLRRWARLGWDGDDPDYTAAREMTIQSCCTPHRCLHLCRSAPASKATSVTCPPCS